jgi:hypothetical protein
MKEEAVLAQSKKPSTDDGNTDSSLERTAGLVSSEPAVPQPLLPEQFSFRQALP